MLTLAFLVGCVYGMIAAAAFVFLMFLSMMMYVEHVDESFPHKVDSDDSLDLVIFEYPRILGWWIAVLAMESLLWPLIFLFITAVCVFPGENKDFESLPKWARSLLLVAVVGRSLPEATTA